MYKILLKHIVSEMSAYFSILLLKYWNTQTFHQQGILGVFYTYKYSVPTLMPSNATKIYMHILSLTFKTTLMYKSWVWGNAKFVCICINYNNY